MFAKWIVFFAMFALLDIVCGLTQPDFGYQPSPNTTESPTCQENICIACPNCSKYQTIDTNVETIILESPYFVYLFRKDSISVNLDNRCNTVVPLTNTTVLFFVTTTTLDGTVDAHVFFTTNGPQGNGTYGFSGLAGQGATGGVLFVSYFVKRFCPGSSKATVFVSEVLAEDCDQDGSNINKYTAFTTTLEPENRCLSKARAVLRSLSGKNTIIRAPYNLTVTCVGSFNGIPIANLNKYLGDPKFSFIDYPSYNKISG